MEVYLYNSTVCRLCGEENDNGTLLYTNDENNQELSEIINTYLPLKVSDDGQLPRTICPGCTIQLEATVEFFNLIIKGQKIIRELYQRESDYKKSISSEIPETDVIAEKIVYEINTSDGVYHVEHPISLQVAGMDKPKRKRGRPSKKPKTPEELAQEAAAAVAAKAEEARNQAERAQDETHGKRRRKTPTRLKEAVQGKELEKIFIEEGVIDRAETEPDVVPKEEDGAGPTEPEVIGHVATSGEPVLAQRGKGRGRPKGAGRGRAGPSRCAQCGLAFPTLGRYMSHVAEHGANPLFDPNNQREDSIEKLEEKAAPGVGVSPAPCPERSAGAGASPAPRPERATGADAGGTGAERSPPPDAPDAPDSPDEDGAADGEAPAKKQRLKCKHCDKQFSTRQSKSMHIKAVHRGERPYACAECGLAFPYPRSLALHALAHRRRRAAAHAGYACDVCGKVLNHPSSVVYHKQSVHAAQRYVCGTCGKSFHHLQLLQRHQLVHSAERPHRCEVCKATFKTKANLRNHALLHTGVKRFSCDICRQRFSHKTSHTLHMRWHTGAKPYSCGTCGKSFSQKGNLSEHERIHTGEKPFACALCPRRFTTSSQHRLHARRHHVLKRNPAGGGRGGSAAGGGRGGPAAGSGPAASGRRGGPAAESKKRVSLLVSERGPPPPAAPGAAAPSALPPTAPGAAPPAAGEDVIYVAYDSADDSTFHIIDPQQVWADKKYLAKKANAAARRSATGTGGGPPTAGILSQNDLKVIAVMGDGFGEPDMPGCSVPAFPKPLEPTSIPDATTTSNIKKSNQEALEAISEEINLRPPNNVKGLQVLATCELFGGGRRGEWGGRGAPGGRGERGGRGGSPIHFRMQDGTVLAVTSLDGETLQILTPDGRAIPVEADAGADAMSSEPAESDPAEGGGAGGVGGAGGAGGAVRYYTVG